MDKNWLIRTKSNHILGPISKEKALELYNNGSIKPDDEVCSGNGFWFFIREDDMVDRFLVGNEPQGFNPISEAKDVLTTPSQPSSRMSGQQQVTDDITMVGGLNLAMLKQNAVTPSSPDLPETPRPVADKPELVSTDKETPPLDVKKKNNVIAKPKISATLPTVPLKKQNYLKYLGILGFIILFMLVYFRKSIIRTLFQGEITSISFHLIGSAHSQEVFPEKKKRLTESSISLEKMNFAPSIGLNGFNVVSSFQIDQINCADLANEVHQLGLILHPPEVINEKFLIKMRDCVLKLGETHPLKKWMKWSAGNRVLSKIELEKRTFLNEIINSQFNLITDLKIRNQIINVLQLIPEETLAEQILKSYLYLMIGNITRSDNILRNIMATSPRVNWEKTGLRASHYHRLAIEHADQLFIKLSKHPADRRTFELFSLYLQSFYNDKSLIRIAENVDTSDVESKLGLKYIKGLAPSFVDFLRLSRKSQNDRFKNLRKLKLYPLDMQSYWVWSFLDINPLVSDVMNPELQRIEKEDQMWFIYLMDNEKLADLYSLKKGKSFLPGRRPYLKTALEDHHSFMLALYKLIELGDIDSDLVLKATEHLTHE